MLEFARDNLLRDNDVRSNGRHLAQEARAGTASKATTPASPTRPASSSHLSFNNVLLAEHLQRQLRRRHLRRRRGAGRLRHADRAQPHREQQRHGHLRAQAEPHDQGQQRQRQRHLGHLRQRGLQRACQRRRRRQPRDRQQRPARPDDAPAVAVLRRPLRRRRRPRRPTSRARHVDRRRSAGRDDEHRATFRFTGTDNASGVEFQCSLDGDGFGPCTSPTTFDGLAGHAHVSRCEPSTVPATST